jgi:plastocyanin
MNQFDKTGKMNMTRHLFKMVLLSTGLAIFGCSLTGLARTVSVGIANNNMLLFFPPTTNIATGDSVLWTWNSTGITSHSTTSDTAGLWDSTAVPAPHTFMNTFSTPGTFPYHCIPHAAFGMKGTIVVTAPNQPPAVTITNPASGTVFAAPANVTIQASATDDVAVVNVQFLVGLTVLTNDNTAPYSAVTNNLAAGSYTLFAIASDGSGATTTNQVAISVVTPVPVLLSAPQPVPTGQFRFSYTANAGLSYIVQSASNLALPNWTTLVTNIAVSSTIDFTDLNAAFNPGFYRVGRLPNP